MKKIKMFIGIIISIFLAAINITAMNDKNIESIQIFSFTESIADEEIPPGYKYCVPGILDMNGVPTLWPTGKGYCKLD